MEPHIKALLNEMQGFLSLFLEKTFLEQTIDQMYILFWMGYAAYYEDALNVNTSVGNYTKIDDPRTDFLIGRSPPKSNFEPRNSIVPPALYGKKGL